MGYSLIDFLDKHRTWLVAKDGNDANGGNPSAALPDTATDAKLTIGAAITAAADGDTILIFPGTYDESINTTKKLNFIGAVPNGREACVIHPTTTPATAVVCGNHSVFARLKLIGGSASANKALDASSKTGVRAFDCQLIAEATLGGVDSFYCPNAVDCIAEDCYMKSSFDCVNALAGRGIVIRRCFMVCDGSNTEVAGLQYRGVYASDGGSQFPTVLIDDCQIEMLSFGAGLQDMVGLVVGRLATVRNVSIRSGIFNASGTADAIGISIEASSSPTGPVLENVTIRTENLGSGNSYDYELGAGTKTQLNNGRYDPAKVSGTGSLLVNSTHDSQGVVATNISEINGDTEAAARLGISAKAMVTGTIDTTATATTTIRFEADDITDAQADLFNGRTVLFTSGTLKHQVATIIDYELNGGRGAFTVTPMAAAPSNDDTFIIV